MDVGDVFLLIVGFAAGYWGYRHWFVTNSVA